MKYFVGERSMDLSRVDREKKLKEILAEGASINRQDQEAPAGWPYGQRKGRRKKRKGVKSP